MPSITEDDMFKEPIAIIGIGGMIGNCKNINEIWDSLYNEKDEIHNLSDIRKQIVNDYLKSNNPKKIVNENKYSKGCFFENPFSFDNDFFNIDAKESKYLNPSYKKMWEVAYTAFENAGLMLSSLRSSNTGVFIGYSPRDDGNFFEMIKGLDSDYFEKQKYEYTYSNISNFISEKFNLKGPSVVIDTSTSSGLVSVYSAVRALQCKECDIAFVGSSKVCNFPYMSDIIPSKELEYLSLYKSKGNKTRSFDNNADGITYGEGAIGYVLKPFNKAIEDGDYIYSVIVGGAINYNYISTNKQPFKIRSKRDLIVKALRNSGISASEISFVEADGIGIKKQDCEEINAISEAFSQMTDKKQFCCIGSVKSNFGNMGSVSGLAGILKVILAMQNNVIPATLNFTMPNKDIDFINTPFYVNNRNVIWQSDTQDVYALINSYGLTGTNCCLVLKNYCYMKTLFNISIQKQLFVISAKNEYSLRKQCFVYEKVCKNIDYDYDDFVNTLCFKREHYKYRIAVIFKDYNELSEILHNFLEGNVNGYKSRVYYGVASDNDDNKKINGIKPLDELAEFYVNGGTITKKNIKLSSYKTVSLPTYEFTRVSYLFGNEPVITARKKYDLINGPDIKSKDQTVYKTKISTKDYWEIGSFLVKGKNTLSFGTLFEIMLQALKPKKTVTFKNICNSNFFQVSNNEKKELIIINKNNEILLQSETNSIWKTNLSCNYTYEHKKKIPKLQLKSDLTENLLENLDIKILEYITPGERWVSCEKTGKANKQNTEFLINLSVSEKYKNEVGNYYIYPVFFDIAVNLVLCYIGENASTIPYSIGSITVYNYKFPNEVNIHIVKKEDTSNNDYRYNIDIYDITDKILVSIKDYHIKSYVDREIQSSKYTAYKIWYNEIKLPENIQNNKLKILYFGDESNISIRFYEEMSKKGNRIYYIDRRQSAYNINNYIKDKNFDFIIISVFVNNNENPFYNNFSYNIITQFNFLKILSRLEGIENKKIVYLMNASVAINITDNIISPEFCAIREMIKAFSSEIRSLNICCFDVDLHTSVNTIVNEIINGKERFVAFRKNRCFHKLWKQTHITKAKNIPFNDLMKTMIIVGGDGKSELLFANHLKEKGFKNIIIFTNSKLANEEAKKFVVVSVDIKNQEEVIKATEKIKRLFGDILGVIILSDAIFYGKLGEKSLQDFRNVFDFKATVINNMHMATLNDNLKYFVTFSNINSGQNLAGFSDFAAANASAQAFAIYRNQLGYNAVNITLPSFIDSENEKLLGIYCQKRNFAPIDYNEALNLFDKVVFGNNISSIIIYGKKTKK